MGYKDKKDVIETLESIERPNELKRFPLGYLFYTFIFAYSIFFIYSFGKSVTISVGGTTNITRVLFSILGYKTLEWLPLISIGGLVLTFFRRKVEDIIISYYILTTTLTIVMTVIILFTV